jgi:hypothetical protein
MLRHERVKVVVMNAAGQERRNVRRRLSSRRLLPSGQGGATATWKTALTENSQGLPQVRTQPWEGRRAMKENIVIPIKIDHLKLWTRRALETAGWLISLGLLAASAAVTATAVLAWLVTGTDALLVAGFTGGLLLGLAGIWQLLRRLDRAAGQLREEPASTAVTLEQKA